ncbi:MAG: hypothetical protein RLZZ388_235, partial [Bacillota bacterium]
MKHKAKLSVVALFVLAGCGGTPSSSGNTTTSETLQPVTLSYAD